MTGDQVCRVVVVTQTTRDSLQQALRRRGLAFPLGARHFDAMQAVVERYDEAWETEFTVEDDDEAA